MQRRQAVLVGELVPGVGDDGLDGAAGERALADDLQVLAALADVDGDGDDLGAGLLGDPADGDGGVQASGVGEYDALGHEVFSFGAVCTAVRSVVGGAARPSRRAASASPPAGSRVIDQHGVVAGDGAEHVRQAGAVERGGEELRGPGRGAQDDEVGRRLGGHQQLAGEPGQPAGASPSAGASRGVGSPPSAGHGVDQVAARRRGSSPRRARRGRGTASPG